MAAVWPLAATGTTAQMVQAVEVMAETRRKFYTILAECRPGWVRSHLQLLIQI